jgi:hypothetical protein
VIDRLFRAHPRSVGESYWQHFRVASRFGVVMIGGGLGAILHAFFPALCVTKGSETVGKLHRQIITARGAERDARSIEWTI